MKIYTHCLSIAGSDPSGGAGIQADIKVFSALGCYASAAVTALTVQNTIGVKATHLVNPDIVEAQIDTILEDRIPDAIKIGMTGNATNIHAIARSLKRIEQRPFVILDPIMISSSGMPLIDNDGIEALMSELCPLCDIITPNLPELQRLSHTDTSTDIAPMIERTFNYIAKIPYILLKGGHSDTIPTDILYSRDGQIQEFPGDWVKTSNTHGTGCALSSAIAAFVALKQIKLSTKQAQTPSPKLSTNHQSYNFETVADACKNAKSYVSKALSCGAEVQNGKGKGAMNHLFAPKKLCISNI